MKNENFLRIVIESTQPDEIYSNFVEFKAWQDGDVSISLKDTVIMIHQSDFDAFLKRREEITKKEL
jgi:hypothetical protein